MYVDPFVDIYIEKYSVTFAWISAYWFQLYVDQNKTCRAVVKREMAIVQML